MSLFAFPFNQDLVLWLISSLDLQDIVKLSQLNSLWKKIINQDSIWIYLAKRELNLDSYWFGLLLSNLESPKTKFIEIFKKQSVVCSCFSTKKMHFVLIPVDTTSCGRQYCDSCGNSNERGWFWFKSKIPDFDEIFTDTKFNLFAYRKNCQSHKVTKKNGKIMYWNCESKMDKPLLKKHYM